MRKHGEVSTSFLVSTILIILGFVLVAIVFYQFSWNNTVDTESCHASVVLRGTLPDVAKSYSPLKCQTEKVCLTKSGSTPCSDVFSGVNNIVPAKISSSTFNKVDNDAKTEIERVISQQVAECWVMMGQGKISIQNSAIATQYGLGTSTSFCVICSRIAADKNLAKDLGTSDEILATADPYTYMKTHKYPGFEVSYLDYIIGSGTGGKGTSFSRLNTNVAKDFNPVSTSSSIPTQKSLGQIAVVFMQVAAPDGKDVLDNYLKTFFSAQTASFAIAPTATAAVDLQAFKFIKSGGVYSIAAFLVAAGFIEANVVNNQALTASYCGDITSGGQTKKGCSVVRVVPYEATEINNYCGVIDGLP